MDNENLISVQLEHKNETFVVDIDPETYRELIQDEQKLQAYAEQVFNLRHYSQDPSGKPDITNFKWSHNLTLLLIEVRLNKENDFNRPICKKKKLWASVAQEISKTSGINVTAEMCDIKYRNLLATYRSNKTKSQQSGESSVTWEYFDLFDRVVGTKASSFPSKEVLGDIESVSAQEEEKSDERADDSLDPTNRGRDAKKKTKKHKPSLDVGEYLYEKQKYDRERKLEKEKKEEERWKETMELKEREIRAIERLAEAIAGKYSANI